MPRGPNGFDAGTVAGIVVAGLLATTIGGLPDIWIPCLVAIVVWLMISKDLSR